MIPNIETALAPEMLVVVLVLLMIGKGLKLMPSMPNWLIVWILPVIGIAFAIGILGFQVDAFIQGILAAAAAVLAHQLYIQTSHK